MVTEKNRFLSRETFGSNSLQICFCLLSGLMCLLPLGLQIPSNIETKTLRDSLSYCYGGFSYCCVASLALVAPLFLDIIIDLAVMSIDATSSVQIKKQKAAAKDAVRFTFLNIPEKILILIGVAIVPTVAFLPKTAENLGLIYLCFYKCQQNLVGGAMLICLYRYDKKYWSLRTTWLSLLFFSTGLVCGVFVSNIYDGESPPSKLIVAADYLNFGLVLVACLIFVINGARWLIMVYCKVPMWRAFFNIDALSVSQASYSVDTADYNFFPMIYTIFGLSFVIVICCFVSLSGRISSYTSKVLLLQSCPYLCFLIVVSTMSMRMVKFEVVQGLYALIESKKSYVRYISHELRTPLNSAFLGLKLLTDSLKGSNSPNDIERREILVDVNVACRTTLDILNDLLCFDKMESGILVAHKHEVPALSFISDCVDMFSAQAREANVTVTFANNGGVSSLSHGTSPLLGDDTVIIDRFKMDQVLRNLISNALKFTPRGGSVVVTATFANDSTEMHVPLIDQLTSNVGDPESSIINQSMTSDGAKSLIPPRGFFAKILRSPTRVHSTTDLSILPPLSVRGRLIIDVKDSGTGMLEKDYSRLFKEIVQFSPEVLQAGGGSGLGLWITKGIVDLHQGEISVHSEGLGYGSSFTVELPMERVIRTTDTATPLNRSMRRSNYISKSMPSLSLPQGATCSHFGNTNQLMVKELITPVYQLLIVDDSPLNRKMLQRIFRAAGHTCEEAEDGVIAVAKVKEMMSSSAKAYSAILMDFVMPNMDGPTATKQIRSLGYTAPIFGVTGNTLDTDIDYFLDSGANKVLAKPLDIDIFEKAISCSEQ